MHYFAYKIREDKSIKKSVKILLIVVALITMFLGTTVLVINSRWFQNYVITVITENISEKTHSDISIERVKIKFFKKVEVENIYFSDQKNDTLLYVDKLVANVDSILLSDKKIILGEILLSKPNIYFEKIDSAKYNFSFLNNLFEPDTIASKSTWNVRVNTINLAHGVFEYRDSLLNTDLANFLLFDDINVKVSAIRLMPNNNYSFKLTDLSCVSQNGFTLDKLTGQFVYIDSSFHLSHFLAQTLYSEIGIDTLSVNLKKYLNTQNLSDAVFDMDISSIDFGFGDISYWSTDFADIDFTANVSGKIKGTLDDLRGRDFVLNIGDFTRLYGDFYMNGLPDIQSTYIYFDLNESYANLNEIRNLELPPNVAQMINNMPDFFNNVGVFSYKGNFTGFVDNFVAYGTAYSNLGNVRTDVSFKPYKNESLAISGHVSAVGLDIGTIFDNQNLDKLTLAGKISGTLDKNSQFDLIIDGTVDSVDFKGNSFKHIQIDGDMVNDRFTGKFSINDKNLQMNFAGKLDLHPELPVFEFNANVLYANLQDLNITPDYFAEGAVNIDANFEGDQIDNVVGKLSLSDLYVRNQNDSASFSFIELVNTPGADFSLLTLKSDVLDATIKGNYSFQNIAESFICFYQRYLSSSIIASESTLDDKNDFQFNVLVKDFSPIGRLFIPGFEMDNNVSLQGYYSPLTKSAHFETSIPFFQLNNKKVEQMDMRFDADSTQMYCRLNTAKLSIGKRFNLYNFTVNSFAQNDELELDLVWNNYEELTYSGTINTHTQFSKTSSGFPHIELNIEPSNLYFADSLWNVENTRIVFDSTSIYIDNLVFHRGGQTFHLNGALSENEKKQMDIHIEDVDLVLFEPLMGKSNFAGRVNGNASVRDVFSRFMLDMDLSVNGLSYNNDVLGDLTLSSEWDPLSEKLLSDLSVVKNDSVLVLAKGNIDPMKSMLDLHLQFNHTPVEVLDVFMPSTFNKFAGLINGDVDLYGKLNHIMHNGVLTPVDNARIGLTYLNTAYTFSDPVYFSGDSIVFKNITAYDEYNNSGVLNGFISHQTFNKMKYDLDVNTDRLLVFNTTANENEYFYGVAFASGNIGIEGAGNDITISGAVRSERGSTINIPFESGGGAKQYDFVQFAGNETDQKNENIYRVVTSGLNMDFDLELTPDVRVQLIFNTQMGDVIRANGRGNLRVMVDRNYNLELFGNYEIEEGDYLFNLESLLNKRFSIQQGSSIEWVGDPYNALIDIVAVYKVKTSLHDLFVGSYENIDLSRRIPVDCMINLQETLSEPEISFDIQLPTAEERVQDLVNQVIVTPEDVNRQVISLLMLGRFYTPDFFGGRTNANAGGTGADLVGTTASELLSNQLSNWFSQMSNFVDLGINYRPGNEMTDNQIEFAISTQILDDRVILNSNLANNANPNSQNNEIIGDFDLIVKLTENGKLQFKAYNRSNDHLLENVDNDLYTQGIGFSYREDFNTLTDLIERYKALLTRKNRKKKSSSENEKTEMN